MRRVRTCDFTVTVFKGSSLSESSMLLKNKCQVTILSRKFEFLAHNSKQFTQNFLLCFFNGIKLSDKILPLAPFSGICLPASASLSWCQKLMIYVIFFTKVFESFDNNSAAIIRFQKHKGIKVLPVSNKVKE